MKKKIICVVCICVLACTLCMGCEKETLTVAEAEETEADSSGTSANDAGTDQETDADETADSGESVESCNMITVFVCGAVADEGVYELPDGSRVNDALSAAGGFAEGADTSYVNLADTLTDGEKVYFPMEGEETSSPGGASSSDGGSGNVLVNINTADTLTLTTLPGIGETRAKRIVAYRDSHGDFASCDDLKNVSGIGDSIYESLKDYITVE